eukprot:jgi/Orpsp1_1/1191907/evm.model.d7180000089309.1
MESDRGISINLNNLYNDGLNNVLFKDGEFKCGNEANYENNTITYYDNYRIEVPINDDQTIILKSMNDIDKSVQTDNMRCSIYDEIIKIAKPMQFPYNTFSEINDFEIKAPISLFFANLYYKHKETRDLPFEDIVNECCNTIDDSFLPECNENNKIKFIMDDVCDIKNMTKKIYFLNCKNKNNEIANYVECDYIPTTNINGVVLLTFVIFSFMVEIIFVTIILKNRKNKCIAIAGLKFLISIAISSILINISVVFWIGELKTYKCIIRIWTMIIGVTEFISTYSIKLEIILSVYSNRNLTKINNKFKSYSLYIIACCVQFLLLIAWTFTQNGVEKKQKYLKNLGLYDYYKCSNGNEMLLTVIFGIDFALLILSVFMAYRGRH